MGLKPISMEEFMSRPNFVPPVTGGARSRPFANRHDETGYFPSRGRSGSFKRRRTDDDMTEVNDFYDLNMRYPPLVMPEKPATDIVSIQSLLVNATEIGNEIKKKVNDESRSEDWKLLARMQIALCDVIAAVVEKGVIPINNGQENAQKLIAKNIATAAAASKEQEDRQAAAEASGETKLREALERADKESVLFDADLGPDPIMNKKGLLAAFTAGMKKRAEEQAEKNEKNPREAVRIAGDAIECINELEFLGMSSKKFENRFDKEDPKNGTFCTMPIKVTFEDRTDRINFERTLQSELKLRAVMSLPKNIRQESKVFGDAIRARYPSDIVIVRPDVRNLTLTALRKKHGEKGWITCKEKYEIPRGILLQGYRVVRNIVLPPLVSVSSQGAEGGLEAASGEGERTLTEDDMDQ